MEVLRASVAAEAELGSEGEESGAGIHFPAFPFKPYPIQLQFMRAVYRAVEAGGVAIVESPTGTGKTLSLICSVFQWLVDHHERENSSTNGDGNGNGNEKEKEKEKKELPRCTSCPSSVAAGGAKDNGYDDEEEPDWMSNFELQQDGEGRGKQNVGGRKWAPKSRSRIANDGSKTFRRKKFSSSSSVLSLGSDGGGGRLHAPKASAQPPPAAAAAGEEEGDGADEQFLVDDYFSDEECGKEHPKRKLGSSVRASGSSSDEDDEENAAKEEEEEEEGEYEPLKVFFCSRTHSQLSQFIGELRRTSFALSLRTVSLGSRKSLCINSEVSSLGSSARINDRCLELQREKQQSTSSSKVQSLGPSRIRRKSVSRSEGCPLMSKQKLQRKFVEQALEEEVLDMEDLVGLGASLGTCPYYGSRRMVPPADLVVLPYQSLLHAGTREFLNIKLKGSVVVIDEAHNLVDTVSDIHSCSVSDSQLKQVDAGLSDYLERFRKRLAATNRRYIEMLLSIVRSFIRLLATTTATTTTSSIDSRQQRIKEMMSINDFVFSLDIDNLNLFKIRKYIRDSNIVHKVSSYGEKYLLEEEHGGASGSVSGETRTTVKPPVAADGSARGRKGRASMAGFHSLAEFLLALTNADSDGRVLVTPNGAAAAAGPRDYVDGDGGENYEAVGRGNGDGGRRGGWLKFVMLNAAKHFGEVLEEARAVVLAGGTLQPVDELRVRLFPQLADHRVHMFGCGHIVPPESILPMAIARGPSNQTFDFTYQARGSPSVMQELGRLVKNVSAIVPEGIVVFFPSFEYETRVFNSWRASGILAAIEGRKAVFREPRDAASVENTLLKYKEATTISQQQEEESCRREKKTSGALLLCVVGGKMSEGINFSDGMGRCIVMVGLPYPNPTDPELIERMQYIDHLSSSSDDIRPRFLRGGQKGREYYENLCMKAVNQSIGRAIRHIRDYAAILLVDARYTGCASGGLRGGLRGGGGRDEESGPAAKLPGWIKDRLIRITGGFGEVHKQLHQFYKYNKLKSLDGGSQ